jgi:glycine/D-amino acid oxidase-like deaminating enzyme/nitrite reductase/ring-hydroxylating ferredoxin subunit
LAVGLLAVKQRKTLMPASALDTSSYWIDSTPFPRFAKLTRDERVDVVIVGGGITGLTAAYLLAAAGRSVAVLERDRCATVDTGHTSAHLTMVTDARLSELVKAFGNDHAQAVWDAGLAAIAQVDAIVRAEKIACEYAWVPGYVHEPRDPSRRSEEVDFKSEAALAVDLGFDAGFEKDVPLMGGPGVRYEDQARFHPRLYLAGLARAIESHGGHIYEHTEASEFCDEPRRVEANGHRISCHDIVIATHTPLMGLSRMPSATLFQTKLALYSSYVIAGRVPRGRVPDALFADTGDPYDYMRVERHRDYDLVIFGGEDHKTGQADDTNACFDALKARLESLLPGIEVTHRWSGQVIESPDGLPYLGRNTDHQYVATGFAGNGMTFGTLGAMIATDGILGRANPWAELFDVGRKKIRGGAWDYIVENKDYPYYLVRDRFAGAEGRTLRSVKRGEGQILDLHGSRVAAYRDENGKTIVRSAICTHLGCEVAWNTAERTWDCPCHGSRFKPTGEVLAGPAESPLTKIER